MRARNPEQNYPFSSHMEQNLLYFNIVLLTKKKKKIIQIINIIVLKG